MRSAGRTSQRTRAGPPAGPMVWTVPRGMSNDSPAGTVLRVVADLQRDRSLEHLEVLVLGRVVVRRRRLGVGLVGLLHDEQLGDAAEDLEHDRHDTPMTQLALSAIGRDRPGIVAEVTRALLGHSLNITDSQMAVLGGRFTMMLIVDAPEATDLDAVREELARTRERLEPRRAVAEPAGRRRRARSPPHPSHIVTVYGVDHPGIVHAVSARLAARAVNVTDLETRLVGDGLYAMVLEVALPLDSTRRRSPRCWRRWAPSRASRSPSGRSKPDVM